MKLLVLTQKIDINDDVLGFFHGWTHEFAKHCASLTVICLERGEYNLPKNVKVLSLGKEEGVSRLKYIFRFYKYIWQERKNYDRVFIHMNPEYAVLGGFFWRLSNKKTGLWYTHKQVDLKLRLAEMLANIVFTASKESFRLKSKKLKVMGHGIDVERFKKTDLQTKDKTGKIFKIITVGRISRIKNYEVLIKAIEILRNENIEVIIIGGLAVKQDEEYLRKLKKLILEKGLSEKIKFIGSVPFKNIADYYGQADLFVHMCWRGGLDKAILEAMASGLPVVTNNEAALKDVLIEYKNLLGFAPENHRQLAEKIELIKDMPPDKKDFLMEKLSKKVLVDHSLKLLIGKIIKSYN